MSKYNRYAKDLDTAFKAARDEYAKMYNALLSAKEAHEKAHEWFEEKYVGEREVRRARSDAALKEAQHALSAEGKELWSKFKVQSEEIRRNLAAELKKDSVVTPEAVDSAAIALMESGVMKAADYESFMNKFDGNETMLRLIAVHAENAAKNNEERGEAARLNQVALSAKTGNGRVLRAFDDILTTTKYCSGQNRVNADPSVIVSMGSRWEANMADIIDNF